MMRPAIHYHLGFDHTGQRHVRRRGTAELRRARERQALQPKVVLLVGSGRVVWRNGLQLRRWMVLCGQTRGDRRCFLMTLGRPPLVRPI